MKNNLTIDNERNSPESSIFLIDSHCHLDMAAYENDRTDVLERAFSHGVKRIVTIGTDLKSSKKCVDLAVTHKQVSATIGVHPHDIEALQESDYRHLEKIYKEHAEHIVGFGEIGLDYYKNYSNPAKQRYHFQRQLNMAYEFDLPIIIHNRNADEDTLKALLQAKSMANRGIMHCFSGDYNYAMKILDLGMYISIPGIVTFKNSTTLQEVARKIPLSSMILETDGPFLAPLPFRGKRNEPAYLIYTAEKIAELRQIDVQLVAKQTTANAEKLFSFKE
jgi:TatD DNase family protein